MHRKAIVSAMRRAWAAIAWDTLELDQDSEGVSSSEVIQLVLDCDRVENLGNLNDAELAYFKTLTPEDKRLIATEAFPSGWYC